MVYPRACGGTSWSHSVGRTPTGLSPRLRGNRIQDHAQGSGDGSIPALAGEPSTPGGCGRASRVYPRACGGNQLGRRFYRRLCGSIPALAGEPTFCCAALPRLRVYPRACGGTVLEQRIKDRDWGLSPRLRGNRAPRLHTAIRRGSIPALAGEPTCGRTGGSQRGVYPRACGGNRVDDRTGAQVRRSIPALAGEPRSPSPGGWFAEVYPRACGGTDNPAGLSPSEPGLSPRLRGNPGVPVEPGPGYGSIPALAGEPSAGCRSRDPHRVYPRACGGTCRTLRIPSEFQGLSPRLRGNPGHCNAHRAGRGSIPALAGERMDGAEVNAHHWSIPALAGEPRRDSV